MSTATTKKPIRRRRSVVQGRSGFRLVKDPISGLTVTKGPVGAPRVSSARIKALSRQDFLRALDLEAVARQFTSPGWHEQALREAEQAVKAGTAKFSDWDAAKKRLRRKTAKLV